MNYSLIYSQLMLRAKSRGRPEGYSELHHIVPKCLGGSDDTDNLVYLTYREHTLAHWLLYRIDTENYGIAQSLHIVVFAQTDYRKHKHSAILIQEAKEANLRAIKLPRIESKPKKIKTRREWVPGKGFIRVSA